MCIENVILQECSEKIEHLIIDGGSKDGTKEIIEKFAKTNKHIRFISESDNGQSNAMNKGISLAQGEFISFLNVDDFYEKGALNEVLEILNRGTYDFIVGNCTVWRSDQTIQYINRPVKLKSWHLLSGYYLPVNPSAYFYKCSLHTKIGPYNETNHFNMDVEFLIKASFVCDLSYFPKNWGNFRLVGDNKTALDQESGMLEIRKKALYNTFLYQSGFKIWLLTLFTKIYIRSIRLITKIKKLIIFPFDALCWKTRKVLGIH
jgi:glycosyltransferase involved in cell wall biosynthesis